MINGLEIFFSNHSAIQAISSFMIAMLTFFYVLYTRRILNQQKKEEVIRNRAYVSTVSVENAEFNPGKNKIHFKFNVKNSGSTPATQVKTSSFFIIKGEKKEFVDFDFNELSPSSFLAPGSSTSVGVLVSGVNLDAIEKDMSTDQLKGDKFVLRIKYSDYAGNEFIFTSEFLSMGKYNEYSLTTLRQFEESVI